MDSSAPSITYTRNQYWVYETKIKKKDLYRFVNYVYMNASDENGNKAITVGTVNAMLQML